MEERKRERISKKLLIKAEGHSCIMLDMSKNGMKLVVPELLRKQVLSIDFRMENLELGLQGIVRWIKKNGTFYGQSEYHVGVSLTDPPHEYEELVDELLRD